MPVQHNVRGTVAVPVVLPAVPQQELVQVLRQFENKFDGAFVRVSDDAPFDMVAAAIQACKTARFATVSYVPLD